MLIEIIDKIHINYKRQNLKKNIKENFLFANWKFKFMHLQSKQQNFNKLKSLDKL